MTWYLTGIGLFAEGLEEVLVALEEDLAAVERLPLLLLHI